VNFQSVMDRPDRVRRVTPPSTIRLPTPAALAPNQATNPAVIPLEIPSGSRDEYNCFRKIKICLADYFALPRCSFRLRGLSLPSLRHIFLFGHKKERSLGPKQAHRLCPQIWCVWPKPNKPFNIISVPNLYTRLSNCLPAPRVRWISKKGLECSTIVL